MKKTAIIALILACAMTLALSACGGSSAQSASSAAPSAPPATPSAPPVAPSPTPAPASQPTGKIYLYGEEHAVKKILNKELELWSDYYKNDGMRHLFIEYPYYTAELLNQWMKADNDDILNAIYNDWGGSAAHSPDVMEFYKKIKSSCPETIYHGTDVGHQAATTGKRFLSYLESNNMKDSEQYLLTQEIMKQGDYYYKNSDNVYRENMMVENFIREYDRIKGESIMGIYGSGHTDINAMDARTSSVPCMANQLYKRYGDALYTEDLFALAKVVDPQRVDTISVAGKDYEASYFGKQDMTGFKNFATREIWRLEKAYDDFRDNAQPGDSLPYEAYPMTVEAGQAFVIDYTMTDGSVNRMYYRSDEGALFQEKPTTSQFSVD